MKQFITNVLMEFQNGRITLEEATDRLLTEKKHSPPQKAKSNRRLKSLCNALQTERNPAKVRQLKNRLSHEFYNGDQAR